MFGMDDPAIDLGSALGTAGSSITAQVAGALPAALAVGAAIIAVTIGWKIFKRFVRG
jgi:hypothetical protein